MKDRPQEQTPSAVPQRAPQDGEIRARWAWVEAEVWTERMLATLETGIEGGKWFRLIDKVWSPRNLGRSLEKVVAKGGSAGIDNQNARQIEEHKDQTIAKLEQELRDQPVRTAGGQAGMDTQAGEQRKATLRSADSERSNRARSPASCHGADLRARLCTPKLRIPTWERM